MFFRLQYLLLKIIFFLSAIILIAPPSANSQTISLTDGSTYNQDFNTLSNTAGSTTNNLTIPGWYITESGAGARDNEQYAVDNGGSNSGDTYSYGTPGSTERALGCYQSGTLIPIAGACFTNNTGKTITSLYVAYYGEQWKIGNTAAARDDRLDFQYSTNATSLTTGTWTDINALDFTNCIKTALVSGALDGNNPANKISISATISGLNIPNGATFWIRWMDLNASGADDGLAIDDFALQPDIPAYVTFTSGSDYTPPSPIPGTVNNAAGRMVLTADETGGSLTSLTVNVSGVHSGVTNYKLWSSTDDTFNSGSDELLSTVSDGAAITFNTFSSAVSTSGTYYFVTADLDAEASGEIALTITNNSSFIFTDGNLTNIVDNDLLSQSTTALPVELTSFTASANGSEGILRWSTATETNNYGFEIERRLPPNPLPKEGGVTPLPLGKGQGDGLWELVGFVQGAGNSNSPKQYSFVDVNPLPQGWVPAAGNVQYRLKQIDLDGKFTYYSNIAEVSFGITGINEMNIPAEFVLGQNYPNPFNPATTIGYKIPNAGHVTLIIYNTLGKEVAALVNEYKAPGCYEARFEANNLSSGVYIYKLTAGSFSAVRKLSILK